MFIPDDYVLASFVHVEQGPDVGTEPFVWTQGYLVGAAADYQAIANTMVEAWETHLAPVTEDTFTLDKVNLQVPAGGGTTGVVSSTLPPVPGESSTDGTYAAFVPKVRKLTARPGRKGRGVCHPPGMLYLGDVGNNGTLTTTSKTRIYDAMTAFGSALGAELIVGVLLHTNEADGDPDPITGISIAGSAGILRRRMV